MRVLLAAVTLAALLVPGTALAADVQFCIEIETLLTDASWTEGNQSPDWQLNVFPTPPAAVTEDYWTTKLFERAPRGARYLVTRNGYTVNQGYLGDGYDANKPAGCTDNITNVNLSASWYMYVYTDGVVQSNFVYSYDHTKAPRMQSLYLGFNPPAGRSTPPIQFPASSNEVTADVMVGYIVASFALYRHAGGEISNKYYIYRCDCNPSTCTSIAPHTCGPPGVCDCTCDWADPQHTSCRVGSNASNHFWDGWRVSSLTPAGINRKFTLVHELGHQIATNITNSIANGGDGSDDDGAICSTPGNPSSHAFWSREWQRAAFKEAFADFYSADVWNSHGQKDCAFKYWDAEPGHNNGFGEQIGGAFFDCAGDDGADSGSGRDDFSNGYEYPGVAFLDDCLGSPYAGKATEMDYTRVFWNVHTDGSTPPTFTTIAQWIRDCGPVTDADVYTRLDARANAIGGSLNTNWDANKTPHNVDNPPP